MPSLKDLQCFVELSDSNEKLHEYGTTYSDGVVETFVAVPDQPRPFAIHFQSNKFIAPGLAMYVFIDGVYQCNRNRQNLKLRKVSDKHSLVDFVVRQKEEIGKNGSMIARAWSFEKLNLASANKAPKACSSDTLGNVGCIEVVVLRCAGQRSSKSASASDTKAKPMNFDGAGDTPDRPFGFDGQPHGCGGGAYRDDRSWHNLPPPPHIAQSYVAGALHSASNQNEQPFTQSYWRDWGGSPYPGKYSGLPLPGYRYGTGPIPHHSPAASMHAPPPSAAAAPVYASSKLPGAWPSSPFGPAEPSLATVPPVPPAPPGTGWGVPSTTSKSQNHVNWGDPAQSKAAEDTSWDCPRGDSWDTKATWNDKHDNGWGDSTPNASNGWANPVSPPASPKNDRSSRSRWGRSSHRGRSRPRESVWESKVDGDGWTHIDASPDSDVSWTSSVRPSSSISAVVPQQQGPPPSDLARKLRSLKENNREKRSVTTARPDTRTASAAALSKLSPFGITFEEFQREASSKKDAKLGWGSDFAEKDKGWREAEPKKPALSPWGDEVAFEPNDKKEIATFFDSWDGFLGRSNRKSKPNISPSDSWDSKPAESGAAKHAKKKAETAWENESKADSWDVPSQPKDKTAGNTSWQAALNGWTEAQKAESVAAESAPPKADNPWAEPTKLDKPTGPRKSRLSKYRQLRGASVDSAPKSHWQFPPPPGNPVPTVEDGKELIEKGVDHHVRTGKGSKYGHSVQRPEYLDSFSKPYAVFRFKYRSRSALRALLGADVIPETENPSSVKPIRSSADIREQLKGMPQDALIDSLLQLQTKLVLEKEKEVKKQEAEAARTEDVGRVRTNEWVQRHSREASEKGKNKKGGWGG